MISGAHRQNDRGRKRTIVQDLLQGRLICDLDGDVVTLTSGKVSAWQDQSGRSNTPVQATAGSRPSPGGSLNGHAGVVFAGSHSLIQASGFSGIAAGDKPRVYCVAAVTPTTAALWELTDSVAANRVMSLVANVTASTTAVLGAGTQRISAAATTVAVHRYEAFVNAADQSETRVDDSAGVSVATAGGLTRAPTRLAVGVLGDGATWPMTGTIYRMLFVNPAPTAQQHAAITSALKTLYAI
jgi:hypothetical protein